MSKASLPMAAGAKPVEVKDPQAKAPKTPVGGVDVSAAKAKKDEKPEAPKFTADFSRLDELAKLPFDAIVEAVGDVGMTAKEIADLSKWSRSDDEAMITANRSPIRVAIIRIVTAEPGCEARKIHLIMRATAEKAFGGKYDAGYLYAPASKTRGMEARGLVKRVG